MFPFNALQANAIALTLKAQKEVMGREMVGRLDRTYDKQPVWLFCLFSCAFKKHVCKLARQEVVPS